MLSLEDACEVLYAAGLPCAIENVTALREDSVDASDTDPMTIVDESPESFLGWDEYLSRVMKRLGYSVPEGYTECLFEQIQFKMADHGMLDTIVDDRAMIRIVEESKEELEL